MGKMTRISYVHSTWNPWYGCAKISPGCQNCFAERWASTYKMVKWGRTESGGTRRLASEAAWREVRRWNAQPFWLVLKNGKPIKGKRRVLVDLCDWLDPDVPSEWLARFLGLIHDTPNLIWYLLTKRPEWWKHRMLIAMGADIRNGGHLLGKEVNDWVSQWVGEHPPDNVRLGVSVEDQLRADERIPALLAIPAAFRWVSFEPLLGPVDISLGKPPGVPAWWQGRLNPASGINFAVIGGESHRTRAKARPCNVEWIRSLVRQCEAAGVPVHVKQLGSHPIDRNAIGADQYPDQVCWPTGTRQNHVRILLKHWQGGDPSEWPDDLRTRHSIVGI